MNKFIRKLLGTSKKAKPVSTGPTANRDSPTTIQAGSENAIRRQLVQVLLRDVLRKHGIPAHWMELHMLVVSSNSRGPGMYVRVVVKQWDQRLMNYAFALQNELMTDIARFEPRASEWLQGISWQLDMANTCPYITVPDKAFWLAPAAPGIHIQSPALTPPNQTLREDQEKSDTREDLERLFMIRDQALNSSAEGFAVGYEKTRPSAL